MGGVQAAGSSSISSRASASYSWAGGGNFLQHVAPVTNASKDAFWPDLTKLLTKDEFDVSFAELATYRRRFSSIVRGGGKRVKKVRGGERVGIFGKFLVKGWGGTRFSAREREEMV
jgi:hypothetical protein